MRNKIQHTNIFSGLFTKSPQPGDIPGGIYIRLSDIATVWTTKVLTIPVTNHLAHITDFARIARINHNKRDTDKFRLIFKKRAELRKSPRVVFPSLCLSNLCSFPDMGQILNGNSSPTKQVWIGVSLPETDEVFI